MSLVDSLMKDERWKMKCEVWSVKDEMWIVNGEGDRDVETKDFASPPGWQNVKVEGW